MAEARRLATAVGADVAVETVPRVGFRLAGLPEEATIADAPATEPRRRWSRRAVAGSALALGAVAVGGVALWRERGASARVATLIERGRALQGSGLPDGDARAESAFREALALDPEKRSNYPFVRLTDSANVLVMPAIHSASISTKLVQQLGGATVVGPLLVGLSKSVQICPLSASVSQILNMATFAAYDVRADEG